MKFCKSCFSFLARHAAIGAFVLCTTAIAQNSALAQTGVTVCSQTKSSSASAVTSGEKSSKSFRSSDGSFRINFSTPPRRDVEDLGNDVEQVQLIAELPKGIQMVSHQPHSDRVVSKRDLLLQLNAARDGLLKALDGQVLKTTDTSLSDGTFVREFLVSIPAARGEYRVRMLIADDRFYQIASVGEPEFVRSKQSTAFLDSFELQSASPTRKYGR